MEVSLAEYRKKAKEEYLATRLYRKIGEEIETAKSYQTKSSRTGGENNSTPGAGIEFGTNLSERVMNAIRNYRSITEDKQNREPELERIFREEYVFRSLDEDLSFLGHEWKELCKATGKLVTPELADVLMFQSYAVRGKEEATRYLDSDAVAILEKKPSGEETLWITYYKDGTIGGLGMIPYVPERVEEDIISLLRERNAQLCERPEISFIETNNEDFISYVQERFWRYKTGENEVMEEILEEAKEILED